MGTVPNKLVFFSSLTSVGDLQLSITIFLAYSVRKKSFPNQTATVLIASLIGTAYVSSTNSHKCSSLKQHVSYLSLGYQKSETGQQNWLGALRETPFHGLFPPLEAACLAWLVATFSIFRASWTASFSSLTSCLPLLWTLVMNWAHLKNPE